MATETRKVLGQAAPGAVLTALYTVPAATQAVVSSVVACNQSALAQTFRVSIAVAGAGDTTKQYLFYDVEVPAYNSFSATLGWTLGATDVVRCYASSASVSFNLFGVEIA